MPRITPSQRRSILRRLMGGTTPSGGQQGGFFSRMRNRFGAVGELIALAADAIAGSRTPKADPQPTSQDVAQAVRLLEREGFEITPQSAGEPIPPPIVTNPIRPRAPSRPIGPITPAGAPTRSKTAGTASHIPGSPQPGAEPWPAESSVRTLPSRIRGAMESVPFEDFSPWILTPQSTHIHAVAYDEGEGILYVQYRMQAKPISYVSLVSVCSGELYKCAVRPDVPGAIYSYGGAGHKVPMSTFQSMIAASHPGQVVWKQLRVCGSSWQHQYPYTVVDVPQGQGIPRKSTRRGFRTRSVPTVGLGTRRSGIRQSTLPEQLR